MHTIKITDYLDPRLVVFLDATTRDHAIQLLVDEIDKTGKLIDKQAFYNAIIEREHLVSTAIGMRIAIPHVKSAHYKQFFITIGIARNGLDWNALDELPVRIIFLIGGPDNRQTEYLQILSKLTRAVKNESVRKKMLTLNSAKDMIELFG